MAFARHSTSLFSIFDSPGTSSIRTPKGTVLPSLRKPRKNTAVDVPTSSSTSRPLQSISIRTPPPTLGKRRQSALSSRISEEESLSRARVDEPDERQATDLPVDASNGEFVHETDAETTKVPHPTEGEDPDRVGVGNETAEEQNYDSIRETGDRTPTETPLREARAAASTPTLAELVSRFAEEQLRPPADLHPLDDPDLIGELQDHEIQDLLDQEDALFRDGNLSDDDGPSMLWGEDIDALYGMNDEDEDEDEEWDEEDDFDMDDPNFDYLGYDGIAHSDDDDSEEPIYPDRRSEETEFGNVEMIIPRRIFKGAKNVETVKDCMLCIVTTSEDDEADECIR